jgi:hypothetical protein
VAVTLKANCWLAQMDIGVVGWLVNFGAAFIVMICPVVVLDGVQAPVTTQVYVAVSVSWAEVTL